MPRSSPSRAGIRAERATSKASSISDAIIASAMAGAPGHTAPPGTVWPSCASAIPGPSVARTAAENGIDGTSAPS